MQPPAGMQTQIRSRIVGVNVPPGERVVTGLVGAAALVFGARRRSFASLLAAGLGTALVVRAVTGRCPMYRARAIRRGIHVRRVVTVQARPDKVYAMWRDLANLPQFMSHVKSVRPEGGNISEWVVEVGGQELTWRAELLEDTPNRRLRWKSLPGGDISHEGEVDIREDGERGTIVEVKMHYFPPGGLVVASVLYGFLRKLASVDIGTELVRLRQLLETGEIATGKRRVEELREDEKIMTVPAPRAATSAQTSAHSIGGQR